MTGVGNWKGIWKILCGRKMEEKIIPEKMPSLASEQLRKIFIGGLNQETTDESLQEYFSRWGECVDVVVMRHSDTGKPRGFGFVTYQTVESVDAVLNVKSHILDGKKIDPKRAVPREQSSHLIIKQENVDGCHRVFVGGLPSNTTEKDIRECFMNFCVQAGYGGVEEVEIMKNNQDGKCRGFGFVTFDSNTDIVDKVCAEKYFEILNKTVEVRPAESRLAMRERRERGSNFDRRRMADRKRHTSVNYPYQDVSGTASWRGNNIPSSNQGAISGGFSGGNTGGYDGFNMNAMNTMALAGMMSMFASYMGMNMGNMAPGNVGNMGNMSSDMGKMNMNQNCGGMSGYNQSVGGSSSTGGHKPNSYSRESVDTSSVDGGAQNSSTYNQQAALSNGGMSGYANMMGAMFGMDPANAQAAWYGAWNSNGDKSQFGVYNNQSSSAYGPTRNTSTSNASGSTQGYKPY